MRSMPGWGWLVVALAAGCAGGGAGTPRSCVGEAGCGPGYRCVSSACVESKAPVAALVAPASPEAFALLPLDGTRSSHPDAPYGGRIESFRWTVESLDRGCEAPAVTGTTATVRVRFECAGGFRVTLVVVDDLGKTSSPAVADLSVSMPGLRGVVAGPDRDLNHVCAGSPLTCTTEGAVSVSAALVPGVETTGTVSYRWSALAPDGAPLDPHRSVSFVPSPEVANPSVRIEVDESAIAALVGDWVLHVAAHDEAGPIGEADARVTVLNRPPVAASAVPSVAVDHTYASPMYRATAVATRWQDPDADPLTTTGSTGDAACSSWSLRSDGTAVVECAQASGGDPDELASFVGTRTVTLRVRDPWQTAGAQSTAITIQNRAVSASSSTVAGCRLGARTESPCCSWSSEPGGPTFCATGPYHCAAGSVKPALADPDGDPLRVTWLGGGFVAQTVVCTPGTCFATPDPAVASYDGCSKPTASRVGGFTATDGLTSGSGTLTFAY